MKPILKSSPSRSRQVAERAPLLAFGAHPDDIEFGCGGVVARETQAGHAAHFVIGSCGEAATNGTPAERRREAEESARLLGATLEFTELGGDAHLEVKLPHTLLLAALIRRIRPRTILAPTISPNQHPDHVALGQMVRDAARLARYGGVAELKSAPAHAIEQLLFYAVTVESEPAGVTPLLYDVSAAAVMQAWKSAMEAHASQLRTRNYVDLQMARARVAGLRAGVEHAMALFPSDALVVDSLASLSRSARQF